MNQLEAYKKAFKEALELKEERELDDLQYHGIPSWDSVGHMTLIAILEEAFDIMMDTDDIIDFNSFEKGKEIMRRYDVEL